MRIARVAVDLLAAVGGTPRRGAAARGAVPDDRAAGRDARATPARPATSPPPRRAALERLAAAGRRSPRAAPRAPVAAAAVSEPAAEPRGRGRRRRGPARRSPSPAPRRFIALVPPERLDDAEPLYAQALAAGRRLRPRARARDRRRRRAPAGWTRCPRRLSWRRNAASSRRATPMPCGAEAVAVVEAERARRRVGDGQVHDRLVVEFPGRHAGRPRRPAAVGAGAVTGSGAEPVVGGGPVAHGQQQQLVAVAADDQAGRARARAARRRRRCARPRRARMPSGDSA